MNAPRKTSPAPVVSTASTGNAGVVHTPAIHNHRAAATQGDAHQRAVSFVQYPERAADLGLTGQCRRHVLGQNRNADRRDGSSVRSVTRSISLVTMAPAARASVAT